MYEPKETIKQEIKEHIEKESTEYKNWYVGIATNPKERLFQDHNVNKNGWWIHREAENANISREIEEYFTETIGTDGGIGGGDESTRYVYAYKKTPYTKE